MREERIARRVVERIAEMSKRQKAYRDFFEKKLSKYGVGSLAELPDKKKKQFFDELDRDWKGEDENN